MRSILLCLLLFVSLDASCQKYFLFIGTYTGSGSKGIYVYTFDAATGKAQWVSNTEGVINPSYLAIAPKGFIIICVH
jgi:6-phosphogluconolactonase